MGTLRFVVSMAAAAIAANAAPAAAADTCASLEARLVVLDRNASGFGDRSLDATILRQRQEYDRATVAARRAGCLGGLFAARKLAPKCGALVAVINRMKANLNRLNAERRLVSVDPFTASRERAGVLRSLAMYQCGDRYAAYGVAPPPRQGLFASLFGRRPVQGGFGRDGFWYSDRSGYGTYRTLCVRTCDGYYFPISFSTVPAKFAADEQTCQSLCPGAPVALYTHRSPGEESDAMVSLTGEPYTVLPTAFRYRRQFDATCTCRPASVATIPIAPAKPAEPSPVVAIPLPEARPTGEDPETMANRAGGLVPREIRTDGTATAATGGDGAVRIVGPSYFIAQ